MVGQFAQHYHAITMVVTPAPLPRLYSEYLNINVLLEHDIGWKHLNRSGYLKDHLSMTTV